MTDLEITQKKDIALKWYFFVIGSNIDLVKQVSVDEETEEVFILANGESALVKVEQDKVYIVTTSTNSYNKQHYYLTDEELGKHSPYTADLYRVDKIVSLEKINDVVRWSEVVVERTGTYSYDSGTKFSPITSIDDAIRISENGLIDEENSFFEKAYLKDISYTLKQYGVDESYDFRDGITTFKTLLDYKNGEEARIGIKR